MNKRIESVYIIRDNVKIILKLSGNVLSRKAEEIIPSLDDIKRLSHEIKRIYNSNTKLIIVHDGGAFTQELIAKYKFSQGYIAPEQIMGMCETHNMLHELNKAVVDLFLKAGIPAMSMHLPTLSMTNDGKMESMYIGPLQKMLEMGFVPVIYGDVVLDSYSGFRYLSSDTIAPYLADRLDFDKICIGTDADGLCVAEPGKGKSLEVLKNLSAAKYLEIKNDPKRRTEEIVRLEPLMDFVSGGKTAVIFNARVPEHTFKALKGEKLPCTMVHA